MNQKTMKEIAVLFERAYDYIYNHPEMEGTDEFRKAVASFSVLLQSLFGNTLVRDFNKYREDVISSDREAAAFMYALRVHSMLQAGQNNSRWDKPVPEMNTRISYIYRDADNYKMADGNEVIVKGEITPEQLDRIRASLDDGLYFIPGMIGLVENRFPEYDPQADHPFFEMCDDMTEFTDKKPTLDISAEELTCRFEAHKGKWYEGALPLTEPVPEKFSPTMLVDDDAGSEEKACLTVKTRGGTLRAYPTTDPDNPGIVVMYQPEGCSFEIDLLYAENTDIELEHTDDPKDIRLFTYGNVFTEDYTDTVTIKDADVHEMMENTI